MSFRIITVALAISALLLTACSPRESATGANTLPTTLRIGVKVDTPPFGYLLAGTNTGFDVDLANALAADIGAEALELVPVTSANRIEMLTSGAVDAVIASMTITIARDAVVDFTRPYFVDGQSLLAAASSPIRSYRDLAGQRVGATEGSTSADNLAEVAPQAEVVTFPDFAALTAALAAGEVVAISSDATILIALAEQQGDDWVLRGQPFSTEPYGIAVAENNSDLRDAFDHALQRLWERGDLQLLHAAWFGEGTPYANLPRFSMVPYPR